MDSLSQFALGAAVGVAVMGRRTAVWKAALWGGVCGTLPDLDAFIDYGDPVSNMTLHRGNSHALFWLTLASPLIAAGIARVQRQRDEFRHWWLLVWLGLFTHPLLDLMTVYGTQLARPFSDHPYSVGSIFIIDPLYTLPLLVGVVAALTMRSARGRRWNGIGLVLSTAYLGWSFIVQQHVTGIVERTLAEQRIDAQRVLVTPTAFNTVLWRVVVMTPDGYREGFYSLLDDEPRIAFDRFNDGRQLYAALSGQTSVATIARFSHGFFSMTRRNDQVLISDLRMGQEPTYTFSFVVARALPNGALSPLQSPQRAGTRPDIGRALQWLWRRLLGTPLAPPREVGLRIDL